MKAGLFGLASALMLAGCASTDKILDQPAAEIFHSQQAPADVAFCLGNKNSVPVLDKGDGSKIVLVKNGFGSVVLAFRIVPESTGSMIEMRRTYSVPGPIWKQCVGA